MQIDPDKWSRAVRALPVNGPRDYRLRRTFAAMLDFIHSQGWQGACHPSSAILAVLLKEQDIEVAPYLGECGANGFVFDHSWVEVDDEVYDAAISNTLIQEKSYPPVFRGLSVDTKQPSAIRYGIHSGAGYDADAALVRSVPFCEYMDNFPNDASGLWGVTKAIGKHLNLRLNPRQLRIAHQDMSWQEPERPT